MLNQVKSYFRAQVNLIDFLGLSQKLKIFGGHPCLRPIREKIQTNNNTVIPFVNSSPTANSIEHSKVIKTSKLTNELKSRETSIPVNQKSNKTEIPVKPGSNVQAKLKSKATSSIGQSSGETALFKEVDRLIAELNKVCHILTLMVGFVLEFIINYLANGQGANECIGQGSIRNEK